MNRRVKFFRIAGAIILALFAILFLLLYLNVIVLSPDKIDLLKYIGLLVWGILLIIWFILDKKS